MFTFNKNNIDNYINNRQFLILLNTGNYVCTPNMFNKIKYYPQNVDKHHAGPNDVIYLHTLAFQQIKDYTIHVVPELKYSHVVHDGSLWVQTKEYSFEFYINTIIPTLSRVKNYKNYKEVNPFFKLGF